MERYYNAIAGGYSAQYAPGALEMKDKYPQNYFRLQILVERLRALGARSVYEVGVGEGTPLALLAGAGLSVSGCDISLNMVKQTRQRLRRAGVNPRVVQWGDIEDNLSIANQMAGGERDAVIALGVMPHVKNDRLALTHMRLLVRSGGRVFVEFRNKLFSLFTFNRLTKEFVLNDLLAGVADDVKALVADDLDRRLALDEPRRRVPNQRTESYDDIPAKFHNPLAIQELFAEAGFGACRLHWYHHHAAPPLLESKMRDRVWQESSRLEHRPGAWQSPFLCSAFIVEAEKS